MTPRKYTFAWFVQQSARFLVALLFACLLLAPEALIGQVT